MYASLVHLGAKGTGVTGIFGILLCLNQPLQYIIEMAISVGVAFVISFMIYKDKEPVVKTAATETTVEKTEAEQQNVVEPRENCFSRRNYKPGKRKCCCDSRSSR